MPLVVSDAGPLIALARINRLALLRDLFGEAAVPTTVARELQLDGGRPGTEALVAALCTDRWIRALTPRDTAVILGLGEGESAAIRLAGELVCPLLIDERRGRRAARKHGIEVIGTGRVLLAAKEHGLIDTVGGALDALAVAGYRLSDELRARLRQLAQE